MMRGVFAVDVVIAVVWYILVVVLHNNGYITVGEVAFVTPIHIHRHTIASLMLVLSLVFVLLLCCWHVWWCCC